ADSLTMRFALALGWAAAAIATAAADTRAYAPPKVTVASERARQQVCSHPLYCDGEILRRVQFSGVFTQDKTFVDMPTRKPVADVVRAFYKLPSNATKADYAQFVDENFLPIGCDIVPAELEDWTDDPPFLRGVTDPVLRGYGMAVHNQWKQLARKRNPSALCDGCESSLLPVKNTFIVPGGPSSREYNYWQSYYINLGLLRSGLYTTAKGAIQNLLDMVATYGFVPTGGRVYFTDRSELPLLALMVKDYYEATNDLDFVASAAPLLDKELAYWTTHRSVDIAYSRNSTGLPGLRGGRQSGDIVTSTTTAGPNLFSTFGPQLFMTSGLDLYAAGQYAFLRPEHIMGDIVTAFTALQGPDYFSTAMDTGALYASSEAGNSPSVQYADLATAMLGPDLFSTLQRRKVNMPTSNPFDDFTHDQLLVLTTVDINQTVSVELNSILYQVETTTANLLRATNNGTDT
ncbi:hypothetical protein H4R21_005987, partial [Coemansia helicoidea]